MSTDVRRARLDAGIAQVDLARRVGISGSYLSLVEAGRRPLTPKLRAALEAEVGPLDSPLSTRLARAEGDALRWEGLYREVAAGDALTTHDELTREFDSIGGTDPMHWGLARVLAERGYILVAPSGR